MRDVATYIPTTRRSISGTTRTLEGGSRRNWREAVGDPISGSAGWPARQSPAVGLPRKIAAYRYEATELGHEVSQRLIANVHAARIRAAVAVHDVQLLVRAPWLVCRRVRVRELIPAHRERAVLSMIGAAIGRGIRAADTLVEVVSIAVADVREPPSRWIHHWADLSIARAPNGGKNDR
jgi:hypothetical protein